MLSNPRFAGLVERIISGAGSRVAKSADYANEIKSIISELASQGIGSPLVSAEARQEGLRLSVETAYEQIRQNPSIAKAVLSALGIEQIGRMTDADVIRTAELFVRMIPKECVMRSFSQLAAKNPAEVRLADILASGKQLIEQLPKDRLDSLVDELRKQGILSRMIATPDARPQQS
ncbi:MAG TPA: hypothetical protein PK765_07345 [bacterium]|nr:hypothetical protein [bacterium]